MKFRTIFTHVIGIVLIAPCPTDLQTPHRGPTQLANDHRPPATSSLAHWLTAHRLTDLYCPTGSPAHRLTGSPAHWPPATGHQPPTTGHLLTCSPAHQPPATGHLLTGSPATGHQPPATDSPAHRPPATRHRLTRHRPPAHRPPANHRPPATGQPPASKIKRLFPLFSIYIYNYIYPLGSMFILFLFWVLIYFEASTQNNM